MLFRGSHSHQGVPQHPWQLVAGHALSRGVVRHNVVEASPAGK